MQSKVSLIIACKNEEKFIGAAIDSLLSQDYSRNLIEIIIVDGRSEDGTINIIKNYQTQYPVIKILDNPSMVATAAFNIGVQAASGDFIFLIGSHCKYPPNYVSHLVSCSEMYKCDVSGGILSTQIRNKNRISNSIQKVLTSKFGVGNATFRTGSRSIKEVDTVAYGCYKNNVFARFGFFNEKLTRNQDIEFNKRIINNGGKILLVPNVEITYYARETLKALSRNNFQNGYWNPLTVFYTNSFSSISLRHFAPMAFLLFILVFALLSFISIYFLVFLIIVVVFYLIVISIVSYNLNDSDTSFIQLIKTFITIHFSYALGSLTGIFKIIKLKFKSN